MPALSPELAVSTYGTCLYRLKNTLEEAGSYLSAEIFLGGRTSSTAKSHQKSIQRSGETVKKHKKYKKVPKQAECVKVL